MPSTRSRTSNEALTDILHNIYLATGFAEGMTYQAFCADIRTVYAVTRCFEIVSEASRRLPKHLKARHPHIPWTDIAGAGSVYRHSYEDVLERVLWQTLKHGLEPLKAVVEEELRRLEVEWSEAPLPRPALT
jgi:uncharacterized protein with HEPN domain